MANETITFCCPACGIKLTVPASLAGISGPCPSCGAQIQAPNPAAAPPVPGFPEPSAPPATSVPAASQPAVAPPPAVKPEPRQLPDRSHHAEIVAKPMPASAPSGDPHSSKPAPLPRHPHQTSRIARFMMLAAFLVATVALVYGVLIVLNKDDGGQFKRFGGPPREESPQDDPHAPNPAGPDPVRKPEPHSPPTPVPVVPPPISPMPVPPEGIKPEPPGMVALSVLEKFLTAKSLEERLPIIETKTPPGELAMSCLAGPLPSAPGMLLEFQESNPLEEVVDFYYSVDFKTPENKVNPQTILVRTRGGGDPKVVVDPFLDLFGGRLAAYASGPNDKGGVFQVIASPLATCTDPTIPNREKKLTLKLLARENSKEIAAAFFGKQSRIGEMLEDGTYSLSYGKAKACTVMLRWNTEDDVNHPYLEAIAIKALDWNP